MNKPDLCITWIKHCDYPLFRSFLKKYKDFFGNIYIYWSEHNRFPYYDHFIQNAFYEDDIFIVNIDPVLTDWGKEDWRNKSTNEMLKYSDSEWVCSIEQDFFAKDWDKILQTVVNQSNNCEYIGWKAQQGSQPNQEYLTREYVHPSFWFMKREALEKTDKDFSANPQLGADHFGLLTRSAIKNGINPIYMQDLGFIEWEDAFHLGGVNQNYLNWDNPQYIFHRPDIFYWYNHASQFIVGSYQQPEFMLRMKNVETLLLTKNPEWGSEEAKNKWLKYFKHD